MEAAGPRAQEHAPMLLSGVLSLGSRRWRIRPFLSLPVLYFWDLGRLPAVCAPLLPVCTSGHPHTVGLKMGENLFFHGCLVRALTCFKI